MKNIYVSDSTLRKLSDKKGMTSKFLSEAIMKGMSYWISGLTQKQKDKHNSMPTHYKCAAIYDAILKSDTTTHGFSDVMNEIYGFDFNGNVKREKGNKNNVIEVDFVNKPIRIDFVNNAESPGVRIIRKNMKDYEKRVKRVENLRRRENKNVR